MIVAFAAADLEPGMVTGFHKSVILTVETSPDTMTRRGKTYAALRIRLRRANGDIRRLDLLHTDPLAILLDGNGEPVKETV